MSKFLFLLCVLCPLVKRASLQQMQLVQLLPIDMTQVAMLPLDSLQLTAAPNSMRLLNMEDMTPVQLMVMRVPPSSSSAR